MHQIGYWSGSQPSQPLNISEEWRDNYSIMSLANQTLIVTTIINAPYCMLRESSKTKEGNDRFEGYVVDLIEELSKILGFKYKFKLVADNAYGARNESGYWNGLIGTVSLVSKHIHYMLLLLRGSPRGSLKRFSVNIIEKSKSI